jgi:hypothetical protein
MRINCGTIAGGVYGKSVFPIHMSDSMLQIAPQSHGKTHGTLDSTHICRHRLHLYLQEDLQVGWGTVAFVHFVTECHTNSSSIVTAQSIVLYLAHFVMLSETFVHYTFKSSQKYKQSIFLHIYVLSHSPWVFPGFQGAIWSIESDICIGNTNLPPPAIVPQLILMVGSLKYYFEDIQGNYLIVSRRVRKVFCGYKKNRKMEFSFCVQIQTQWTQ